MFWHLYHYRIKVLLGNRSLLFWSLAFPLLMGCFFKAAFGNLDSSYNFETIKVGVVTDNKKDNYFIDTLKNASSNNKEMFEVSKLTEGKAKQQLLDEKISGYYRINGEDIELIISTKEVNPTILKAFLTKYEQAVQTINTLKEQDPSKLSQQIIQTAAVQKNFTQNKTSNQNKLDTTSFMFFTLIGMTIMMGSSWGIVNVNDEQANQSENGIRLSMTPRSKKIIFISNTMASLSVFLCEILMTLLFFHYILKIDLGDKYSQFALVIALGSLTSIAMGMFIGHFIKGDLNLKIGIGVAIQMVGSFLAGMMGPGIKVLINQNFPIINYLNPVNLISESLYKLFYYQNLSSFYTNMLCLTAFFIFFFAGSVIYGRKDQYVEL